MNINWAFRLHNTFWIILYIIASNSFVEAKPFETPWNVEAEFKASDGNVYCFLDYSVLQAQRMAIAKKTIDSNGEVSFKILGTNNGDSPRSWVSVIRPVGAPEKDYGQLYLNKDGFLVGIRYSNKCFLAYDTVANHFYGHGDVEAISPFILIGPTTSMHKPDVESIAFEMEKRGLFLTEAKDIRSTASYLSGDPWPGYPGKTILMSALNHPNHDVQLIASKFLDIHNIWIEKASKRVSEYVNNLIKDLQSSDEGLRKNAASELGSIGSPGGNPAIPYLVIAITDKNEQVSSYAAQSLGLIGEPSIPSLLKLLNGENKLFQSRALFGLSAAGPSAFSALTEIINFLSDKNPDMRAKAAIALGRIGPKARDAIPSLTNSLKDEDESVRLWAKRSLMKISTIPELISFLSNKDTKIREEAAMALGRIGPKARNALIPLTNLLNDDEESVRFSAKFALRQIQQ